LGWDFAQNALADPGSEAPKLCDVADFLQVFYNKSCILRCAKKIAGMFSAGFFPLMEKIALLAP
jgi:hypothetical protein